MIVATNSFRVDYNHSFLFLLAGTLLSAVSWRCNNTSLVTASLCAAHHACNCRCTYPCATRGVNRSVVGHEEDYLRILNNNSEIPIHVSIWACANCEQLNKPRNVKCAKCASPCHALKDSWTCHQCMCANPASKDRCLGCKQSHMGTLSRKASIAPGIWRRGSVHPTTRGSFSTGQKTLTMKIGRVKKENEKLAGQQLEKIQHYCQIFSNAEARCQFVSPLFPPHLKSLYANGKFPENGTKAVCTGWRRTNKIRTYEGQAPQWVVYNSPCPADVVQGLLGSCWFLSALSVLAEDPRLVEKMFITKTYNEYGAYQMQLFHNGEWVTLLMDDTFPCKKEGSFAYSQARRGQLWVPFVEKAMAQLHGSYEALHGGTMAEAFQTLTGCPVETIELGDSGRSVTAPGAAHQYGPMQQAAGGAAFDLDAQWQRVMELKASGSIMGASIDGAIDDSIYADVGLVPNHAYSVLDVKLVDGKHRLVRLRNPWSSSNWSGAWSDDSKEWTPQLKTECMAYGAHDEGIFWMLFGDFCKYFTRFDICKVAQDWCVSQLAGSIAATRDSIHDGFQVIARKTTTMEISLFPQIQSSRLARSDFDMGVVVLHAQKGKHVMESVMLSSSRTRFSLNETCAAHLTDTQGTYVIVPFSFMNMSVGDSDPIPFVCMVHSSSELIVAPVTLPPSLVAHAVTTFVRAHGQPLKIPAAIPKEMRLLEYESIFVADNAHKSKHFQVDLQITDSTNMENSRSQSKMVDIVPKQGCQLITALTPISGRGKKRLGALTVC